MGPEFFCKMRNSYDGHLVDVKYERKSSSTVSENCNNEYLGEVISENEFMYHNELGDQGENNHRDKNSHLPVLHGLFLSKTRNTKSHERNYGNKIPGLQSTEIRTFKCSPGNVLSRHNCKK